MLLDQGVFIENRTLEALLSCFCGLIIVSREVWIVRKSTWESSAIKTTVSANFELDEHCIYYQLRRQAPIIL